MKDKIALLMEETGCDYGEAELALELCGYEVEKAVQAIPRLFQNIAVLNGKLREDKENLYGLFLVILNLKGRSLVRARAVVSYNPAVYCATWDQGWFEFEKCLYACRLWEGTLQALSQEVEQQLVAFFASAEAEPFYSDRPRASSGRDAEALRALLARRLEPAAPPGGSAGAGNLQLVLHRDVLDMGQFQELGADAPEGAGAAAVRPRRRARGRLEPAGGVLVLRIALEPDAEGTPAGQLRAGDLVYAHIVDPRDIAQYLARLLGARPAESGTAAGEKAAAPAGNKPAGAAGRERAAAILAPVEAVETGPDAEVGVRVRLSLGVCGDVNLPPDIRLSVVRKNPEAPWWRKFFK